MTTTADSKIDSIADKITKLLNKAESTTSEHEAETFRNAAERLMQKWAIDQEMIDARNPEAAESFVTDRIFRKGAYVYQIMVLYNNVSMALGKTKMLMSPGLKANEKTALLFGKPSDIDRVKALTASLEIQMNNAYSAWKKTPDWKYQTSYMSSFERMKVKASFFDHFAKAVYTRLVSFYNEAVQESGEGTELVLASNLNRIDNYVAQQGFATKAGRRRRSYNVGSSEGRAAGSRADIGNGIGNKRKALA